MIELNKKMTSSGLPPDKEMEEPLIRPDTFWELIEKLLLHKTRDEQSRRRHNAALSALCRGHALPRFPRREQNPKTNKPNKCSPTVGQENISIPNSCKGKPNVNKPNFHIAINEPKNIGNIQRRSRSANEAETSAYAKRAKSECLMNDLDIVYLKDTSIPASERLWRYAIKNRKRSENLERENCNDKKQIPCIRSNEAIYLGLRKRMEAALQERKANVKQSKVETMKRRHSCEHIQKIRSDMYVNNRCRGVPSVKRTPSFQNQQTINNANKKVHKSTKTASSLKENILKIQSIQEKGLKIENGIQKWQSREQLFSPWGNEDPWSDLTKLATVKSKERFDSKKALYNSVIKRRLNCGSQLDSLNKEIINKRNNPRTVLCKDTTRKYTELKNEYLNLCYQESTLRHQISLLHAEIYMMQNKGYHRTPASVKTITFDAQTTPLHRKPSTLNMTDQLTDVGAVPMFPCLKAPRPLVNSLQKQNIEKQIEKTQIRRIVSRAEKKSEKQTETSQSQSCLPDVNDSGRSSHGVCSIYSITPQIVTQQREPFTLSERKVEKLVHRLPRMATDIDTPSSGTKF